MVSRSCCSPCWGVALILAGFRVDVPMLSGGTPATWNGWVHGIAFLLISATGVLTPLTMALAVRRDPGWRPITVVSVGQCRPGSSSPTMATRESGSEVITWASRAAADQLQHPVRRPYCHAGRHPF